MHKLSSYPLYPEHAQYHLTISLRHIPTSALLLPLPPTTRTPPHLRNPNLAKFVHQRTIPHSFRPLHPAHTCCRRTISRMIRLDLVMQSHSFVFGPINVGLLRVQKKSCAFVVLKGEECGGTLLSVSLFLVKISMGRPLVFSARGRPSGEG